LWGLAAPVAVKSHELLEHSKSAVQATPECPFSTHCGHSDPDLPEVRLGRLWTF
jgi:hypothetical protein